MEQYNPWTPGGGRPDAVRVLVVGDDDDAAEVDRRLASGTEVRSSVAAAGEVADLGARPDDGARADCVVVAGTPDGPEAVGSVRERRPDLPVVLWTAADAAGVSEAVAAGATEYVPRGVDGGRTLSEAVLAAVEAGRDEAGRRTRTRGFESFFQDPETFRWVLDPSGTVRRANRTVLAFVGADNADLAGTDFWALSLWSRAPETRDRLRSAVERAADGAIDRFEMDLEGVEGEPLVIEFAVRPARDQHGDVSALLVEGTDVGERVALERELRDSEELHRVTLNNMTDTVLITDDDGELTYVCRNVHFIFGYTAGEIRELGTIDALLGADLFDPAELEESGVLTNVECTATDRAGEEHTLLVNVRRVDIQGGTTLYSCRDVTRRKQRERALARLQRTARELLEAGSPAEIARVAVADAAEVLDLPAVAVYRFDVGESVLDPAAAAEGTERLAGPMRAVRAEDDTVLGRAFVEGETVVLEDEPGGPLPAAPGTDLQSGVVVPLGDHGALVAGSTDPDPFDEVTRELADLLAATVETALDRAEREAELRERDRTLRRQNRRLTRLNRVNETIREVHGELVGAETRDGVERAVCERLTADDRFAFAWVGGLDPATGTVEPRAWAGEESGYLDSLPAGGDEGDGVGLPDGDAEADGGGREPTGEAVRRGETVVAPNVADDLRGAAWRRAALSRGYQSAVSVPLSYEGVTYGALSVYADRASAFDETAREVLAELGDTVAYAISAVERRRSLLADAGVELEFRVDDEASLLYRLARAADCTLRLEGTVPTDDGGVTAFVAASGAPAESVLAALRESVAVTEAAEVRSAGEDALLRLTVPEGFLPTLLADHGGALRSFEATPDGATVVVAVAGSAEARTVVDALAGELPGADLVAKRSGRETGGSDTVLDRLTDRQLEIARTAYHGGFFESPRERTGDDLAATLDISRQSFHQQLRAVQHKLFDALFDDGSVRPRGEVYR